jgi:TatD DNase family protein
MSACWIDTHCHLDAPEFARDVDEVVARARAAGVGLLVLPAVAAPHFESLQSLARRHGMAYALGLHPLHLDQAGEPDLEQLRAALQAARDDPLLVAVGEIGLDHFTGPPPELQETFYQAQLKIARDAGLPVLLHCRRSADGLLKGLRRIEVPGGIVHAFNGSRQQADALVARGFALGFGGAMTFDRALQIRSLAAALPETAWVLETDAPDIPPHWLYRTAQERAAGARSRNEPAELPRIAQVLAELRGASLHELADRNAANATRVLPRLAPLLEAAA